MIRHKHNGSAWSRRAHALADDLDEPEPVLMLELASIVRDWPARNAVVRARLDDAAGELLLLADNGHN